MISPGRFHGLVMTIQKYRVKSAKMLATLLHFLQGTPYIYEGEEIGNINAHFKQLSDYQDLETHNIYKQLVTDES